MMLLWLYQSTFYLKVLEGLVVTMREGACEQEVKCTGTKYNTYLHMGYSPLTMDFFYKSLPCVWSEVAFNLLMKLCKVVFIVSLSQALDFYHVVKYSFSAILVPFVSGFLSMAQ